MTMEIVQIQHDWRMYRPTTDTFHADLMSKVPSSTIPGIVPRWPARLHP